MFDKLGHRYWGIFNPFPPSTRTYGKRWSGSIHVSIYSPSVAEYHIQLYSTKQKQKETH